jgi:hypothetical protein
MNIILKYNIYSYNYNLNINLEIGYLFEEIVKICNLNILNIEKIILYINSNNKLKKFFLGIDKLSFYLTINNFIIQNNLNYLDIIQIEVVKKNIHIFDKNNILLNEYYKWYKNNNNCESLLINNIINDFDNIKENNDELNNNEINNNEINNNEINNNEINNNEINNNEDYINEYKINPINNQIENNFKDLFENNQIENIFLDDKKEYIRENIIENNDYKNIENIRNNLSNNISVLFQNDFSNYINILNDFIFIENDDDNYNNDDNIKIVMSENEFNKLEIIDYNEDKFNLENKTCNICLDDFIKNEKIIKLKCNHYYHKKCIYSWLKKHSNKCPICRFKLTKSNSLNF